MEDTVLAWTLFKQFVQKVTQAYPEITLGVRQADGFPVVIRKYDEHKKAIIFYGDMCGTLEEPYDVVKDMPYFKVFDWFFEI